ncbi:hypothetical protein GLOIN_2v1783038 [Rhizophagus irregularis DAOM 181602=DAOM 197198]|uniref:Uncharacterized protein n=1 Tax=Rhizophagus irregularis (strain DAOM 181602 / DAOM 197198 / MUCL 43194) TaxID=747089 RepID=A0A2P4PG52_RHIID|nr:hypothetical protein GLOIN_2v1783038 [Rhizophagus irregularis DAOM 181602=DAOM 197198]POG64355.1 hypothetical protein GLOIN_2v1783038 [Rhizophagus irregularis DAOM 181602=DAOM 197198]GBC29624.2 hypothetical protein GLOIN_2v1783038 [Rhizophagus irregularis DAOM 181602=DAOM 197198]|eukprot:XP_025171221.1 hypothetical protein GLOIN_2v1783038 [Rhizophagus irregularis DAOM 181602=DAOM 197198]
MTNVYILKNINNKDNDSFKGVRQRLGGTYEQELKEKLYSAIKSKAEINDLSEKLLEVKYTAKIQSLKSEIKTLKRKATLAQKASSADKVQILSLETKIRELEGKLEDIDLERTYHDLDVMGEVIEEPVQISLSDPKEIDSLRLELEQLELKENNEIPPPPPPMNDSSQIISVDGAETVSLPSAIPIVASSLMSPAKPKEKSNTKYSPNWNYFLSSPNISEAGIYDQRPEVRR